MKSNQDITKLKLAMQAYYADNGQGVALLNITDFKLLQSWGGK